MYMYCKRKSIKMENAVLSHSQKNWAFGPNLSNFTSITQLRYHNFEGIRNFGKYGNFGKYRGHMKFLPSSYKLKTIPEIVCGH